MCDIHEKRIYTGNSGQDGQDGQDGKPKTEKYLKMNLTIDHRYIDGAIAAKIHKEVTLKIFNYLDEVCI